MGWGPAFVALVTGSPGDFMQPVLGKHQPQDFSPLDLSALLCKWRGLSKTFLLSLPTSCSFLSVMQAGCPIPAWLLKKSIQMIDSCSSSWLAHLGENKAASCVFTWASKWDSVPLSGGHGSGPGQKPLPGLRSQDHAG